MFKWVYSVKSIQVLYVTYVRIGICRWTDRHSLYIRPSYVFVLLFGLFLAQSVVNAVGPLQLILLRLYFIRVPGNHWSVIQMWSFCRMWTVVWPSKLAMWKACSGLQDWQLSISDIVIDWCYIKAYIYYSYTPMFLLTTIGIYYMCSKECWCVW